VMSKIIKLLIIIGTAALVYYQPIVTGAKLNLSAVLTRSDFIFTIVVVLWLASHLFSSRGKSKWGKHVKVVQNPFHLLALFLVFTFMATLLSFAEYGMAFDIQGWSRLVKMLVCILLAWVVYRTIKDDAKFYQWLARALYLPIMVTLVAGIAWRFYPSILPAFISSAPGVSEEGQLALVSASNTFQGLTWNPWLVVYSCVVALSFVWVMALHNFYCGKLMAGFVKLLFCMSLLIILYWTAVRTTLILVPIVFWFGGLLTLTYLGNRKNALAFFPFLIMVVPLLLGTAMVLAPPEIRDVFIARFSQQQMRLYIWQHYGEIALSNPLGVGFNFYTLVSPPSPVGLENPDPHNVVLSVLMIGGWGGVLSVVVFLWLVTKSVKGELRRQRGSDHISVLYIGVVTAYLCSWVIYMATGIDPFRDFTHSILLALVLARPMLHAEIPIKQSGISKVCKQPLCLEQEDSAN